MTEKEIIKIINLILDTAIEVLKALNNNDIDKAINILNERGETNDKN